LGATIFLLGICCNNTANAIEFGQIKYNNNNEIIDYSKINKNEKQQLADNYLTKALTTKDLNEIKTYLKKAAAEYFIMTKLEPENIYPVIQLARIYDYLGENSYSKAYFFRALKINKNDAATNYYFGEFYYTREDYKRALFFYQRAFKNGQSENYAVLIKMAIMYEKLGDLLRANQYYKKAFLANPNNEFLPEKIRELENIKYIDSGYYTRSVKY